tara:strand:+ start:292 stop:2118 length:1827 start_codon:yes stop_codon:yes gene_type:complete
MSTFLISRNNLRDLTNIEKARNNLGIGTLAIQDSNNVNITGGSISVSNLVLQNSGSSELSFVVSLDDIGTLGFYKPNIEDWVNYPQNEIDISTFSNNVGYLTKFDLEEVAFSGDYNDLINSPCNLEDFFNESTYLLQKNNLKDVHDIDITKSNLGLGPFASFQTTDTVTISNLYVLNDFHFMPDRYTSDNYKNKYLQLTEYNDVDGSMTTEWKEFPIAGKDGNKYGLLEITNEYKTNLGEFTAPSSRALYEAYTDISSRIADTTEQKFMNDLISEYGLLTKEKHLSEFATHISEVKSNLDIGTLSEQNTSDVRVDNLTITNNFTFNKLPTVGNYLRCINKNGQAEWKGLPLATEDTPGMVRICSDMTIIDDTIDDYSNTVPNIYAISNIFNEISDKIDTLSNNVPTKVRDLTDWRDFCLVSDAFKNINVNEAKKNLKLKEVAWSGRFDDLNGIPTRLSQFHNDVYLQQDCNLSDLPDPNQAIINLGLGSMCKQNSENVLIKGGIANFTSLTITDNLVLDNLPNNADTANQVFYLAAENQGGKVSWKNITSATEELFGVVQLTHDISNKESLYKVASATAVFKAFTEIQTRIEDINRRIDGLDTTVNSF